MKKELIKKVAGKLIALLILLISLFLITASIWVKSSFGNVTVEEIIFNLKVPLVGTNMTLIYSFILYVVFSTITLTIILYFLLLADYKVLIELELKIRIKKMKCIIFPFHKSLRFIIIGLIFGLSLYYSINKLKLDEYIKNQLSKSTLIEDEYVDPRAVNIKFNNKRNLVYIYVESLEASYSSISNGGIEENDLIEELSNLAEENISFSNTDKLGGALSVPGTTWTVGALVAQTSGLPLKLSIDDNAYSSYNTFLPGAYVLGDILKDNGYNQEIMFGSYASYAGKSHYYEEHGKYKVWDVLSAIKEGKMTKDDIVWWGFEDKDLFEYAKEHIINLSKKNKPFNFSMLTADTHFEDGYLSKYCNSKYEDQYSSVIACESKLIYEFIEWIKLQDFYENTTIIIVGDHLTMDTDFFDGIDPNYNRTIYNAFINSTVQPQKENNRIFTSMDLFPTTLVAMGAKIEGDRLGIGTNLFSDKKTVAEKYGIKKLRTELNKTSKFYNKSFLYSN